MRHVYAVWKLAETGTDPRADQYSEPPFERYHDALRRFLIGLREELGVPNPTDVLVEPEW